VLIPQETANGSIIAMKRIVSALVFAGCWTATAVAEQPPILARFCLRGSQEGAKMVCFTGPGPAVGPKSGARFEAEQQALQAELSRRAEEARASARR
jgi:hypothetical protein